MSEAELAAFLAAERIGDVRDPGAHGWPHPMPPWCVLREPSGGENVRARALAA
jgi:hypothetical protein